MMKKLLFLSIIALTVFGCNKEEPLTPYKDAKPNFIGDQPPPTGGGGGGGGGTNSGTFTATIDGQAWSSTSILAQDMLGTLMISGSGPNAEHNINMSFSTTSSTGTHDFDNFMYMASYSHVIGSDVTTYQALGTGIEIISLDTAAKTVKANFTFTAKNLNDTSDVVQVTNGSFNLTYTTYNF